MYAFSDCLSKGRSDNNHKIEREKGQRGILVFGMTGRVERGNEKQAGSQLCGSRGLVCGRSLLFLLSLERGRDSVQDGLAPLLVKFCFLSFAFSFIKPLSK